MAVTTYYPLIHNEWVKTSKSMKVKDPYTGKVLGRIFTADANCLDMAVKSARKGFLTSRELSGFDRHQFLMKIAEGIERHKAELVETIVKESGKPITYAKIEVDNAQNAFAWAAEEARRRVGAVWPLDNISSEKSGFALSRAFPIGIVLGISGFSFPLGLIAEKIAPAIAGGNTVIIKPSTHSQLTSLKLAEIIKQTNIPSGLVNIVPADGKSTETLVKDGRIRMLSFTGRAAIGWYLKSISGKKQISLRLGGNAAALVEEDCNYSEYIPLLVNGSFSFAGQTELSLQRIYVSETFFESFVQQFVDETAEHARFGDPTNERTMVGPMINVEEAKRIENWIKEAEKEGAKIVVGGKREKNMLEPTVITNTTPDMKIVCEEALAPVVIIEPFRELSDGIQMINNSYYGLQAALFSNDIRKIQRVYQELDVGHVSVNEYPTFWKPYLPLGGSKESGSGRGGIRSAIEEMTEAKLLTVGDRIQ